MLFIEQVGADLATNDERIAACMALVPESPREEAA
jgi:hypothetical protein